MNESAGGGRFIHENEAACTYAHLSTSFCVLLLLSTCVPVCARASSTLWLLRVSWPNANGFLPRLPSRSTQTRSTQAHLNEQTRQPADSLAARVRVRGSRLGELVQLVV